MIGFVNFKNIADIFIDPEKNSLASAHKFGFVFFFFLG